MLLVLSVISKKKLHNIYYDMEIKLFKQCITEYCTKLNLDKIPHHNNTFFH